MALNTPLIIAGSTAAVLLALSIQGFTKLYTLLLGPLCISLAALLLFGAIIIAVIRLDRDPYPIATASTRRRHALRSLTFTSPSAWSTVQTQHSWEEAYSAGLPASEKSASPALQARLLGIFALVRTAFILPWFDRISPSSAFPDAVEVLVRKVLTDITTRVEKVDWSAVIVSRILPIVETHLHHYRTVEHLTLTSSGRGPDSLLPLPLPAKAHKALSERVHLPSGVFSPSIEAHLRDWLRKILGHAISDGDRTEVVKTLAREIILGAAVLPTFDMICDSDFWNRQIDEKGGRYLHEQYVSHNVVSHYR